MELFGENSAILDLLRQDDRLQNLFAGVGRENRAVANAGRPGRDGRSGSGSANALAQALFGHLLNNSSGRGRDRPNVVVN